METTLTLLAGLLIVSIVLNLLLFFTSGFNHRHFDIYTLMEQVSKTKDLYISVYYGADGHCINIYPLSYIQEGTDENKNRLL